MWKWLDGKVRDAHAGSAVITKWIVCFRRNFVRPSVCEKNYWHELCFAILGSQLGCTDVRQDGAETRQKFKIWRHFMWNNNSSGPQKARHFRQATSGDLHHQMESSFVIQLASQKTERRVGSGNLSRSRRRCIVSFQRLRKRMVQTSAWSESTEVTKFDQKFCTQPCHGRLGFAADSKKALARWETDDPKNWSSY